MRAIHPSMDTFPLHRVPLTRPFIWLAEGWDGLMHSPGASLAYGVIISFLGALILAYQQHPLYVGLALTAFLVVGPVITAGVCELSRCRDHGAQCDFQRSLEVVTRNRERLFQFACVLATIAIAGIAIAGLFLLASGDSVAPSLNSTVWGDVLDRLSPHQLTAYATTFLVICAIVFALSVVSVPMIIDRHVTPRVAMRTSARAFLRDFPAMILWALIIVALVAFGFGTRLWGMILVVPLLGHATWYAYRDIVEEA
ncbi:DUF2189 domain-containing protein [Haliea sp. E17]|uniref:DUF2189 domain-containing protein n=1 Tax=Haliea sp. E17 TaxID=3401576 RepID=UPI003AB08F4D